MNKPDQEFWQEYWEGQSTQELRRVLRVIKKAEVRDGAILKKDCNIVRVIGEVLMERRQAG